VRLEGLGQFNISLKAILKMRYNLHRSYFIFRRSPVEIWVRQLVEAFVIFLNPSKADARIILQMIP
jgi:hypothetical protein